MATDQGKTSNLNAMAIVAKHLDVGHPASGIDHLSHALHPRHLRQHGRHFARRSVRSGAHHADPRMGGKPKAPVFENVALWKRARYFPRGGEDMHAAVARECRAVRGACGIFDASTLGKIEVAGPRWQPNIMNRLYVNNCVPTSASGRSRYGILLREDGFIFDDGVVARTATPIAST